MYPAFQILSACLLFAPAQADKPQPKLELALSLSKSEIVQLEPIALIITVKNLSKEPQTIYPMFNLKAQYLRIFLTTDDGKTTWLQSAGVVDGAAGPRTLSPKGRNDVIRYRLIFSDGPHSWMDTRGDYKLHIRFYCLKGAKPLVSNPVKVTVKEAKGVNKQALDRFRGYPQADFLARGTTANTVAEQFRFVIRKYPKSVYTPWCYYILGWAAQTTPDSSRARDYYGRLLKDYPKFPMKTEVEYELARELLRERMDEEAAIDQIETLASKHSDLWLFRRVKFTLKYFREQGKIAPAKELPSHYGL